MTDTVITVKGELLDGVPYQGALHVQFEIRPATVEDQLRALEAVAAESTEDDVDVGTRNARINVGTLVNQLVSLGEIPPEMLTYAWLRNVMSPSDFDILEGKSEEARKKRRELPKAGATF